LTKKFISAYNNCEYGKTLTFVAKIVHLLSTCGPARTNTG